MATFDDHAYRMNIVLALKEIMEKQIKAGILGYTQGKAAVNEIQTMIPRRLPPGQMRAWVEGFVRKYPQFASVLAHPSYLDDERGTWDSVAKELATALAEPIVSYVKYETREFTRQFNPPVRASLDAAGLYVLYTDAQNEARRLAERLKPDGWELDESIDDVELMKAERVTLQRDGKKHVIGKDVTIRFRRPRRG